MGTYWAENKNFEQKVNEKYSCIFAVEKKTTFNKSNKK